MKIISKISATKANRNGTVYLSGISYIDELDTIENIPQLPNIEIKTDSMNRDYIQFEKIQVGSGMSYDLQLVNYLSLGSYSDVINGNIELYTFIPKEIEQFNQTVNELVNNQSELEEELEY